MKEIKFRMWDKEKQQMIDNNELLDTTGAFLNLPMWDTYILMQFTGLIDKAGVEIYEGDVVRCWGGEHFQGYWEHDTTIIIKDMIYECFMMGEIEFLEVLGNIYENPELKGVIEE